MIKTILCIVLIVSMYVSPIAVLADVYTLTINTDTTESVDTPAYFSGFNTNEVKTTWTYDDPLFQSSVKSLYPKTLRWPAGGAASKFDWKTGDISNEFMDRAIALGLNPASKIEDDLEMQAESRSKLGVNLVDFSELILKPNNAKATIMINSLTDIPEFPGSDYAQSARELAAYARDNNVPVEYWEIMNEPFLKNKLTFWDIIGDELGIIQEEAETLGHYNGRVYIEWMKIFNDAIKSEIPDANVTIMFGQGKLVEQTYNGQTDYDYQTHFNEAIWEYGQAQGAFWDAMSFHWYACYPIFEGEETMLGAEYCLNGNLRYLESTILDYYIQKNELYLGNADLPIIITETNVSPDSPIMGTLFNTIYVAEMLGRLSAIPQVKSINFQCLAANGVPHWAAFRLKTQGYWADVSEDTYASTPDNIFPSVLPFYNSGLVSFTTQYVDAGRETGVISLKDVPTLPDFTTNPAFSDYQVIFTTNGVVYQFVNQLFANAKASFPVEVTSGDQSAIIYGEQPTLPVITEIGDSVVLGDALYMRGYLSNNNIRRVLITNKSPDTHVISINWQGIPITSKVTHTAVTNTDHLVKNTDSAPYTVESSKITVTGPVTVGPYSVNVIEIGRSYKKAFNDFAIK